MSQNQNMRVKLYSNSALQYSDIDSIKKFIEESYSYTCQRLEFNAASKKHTAPGKTAVLVVKNYLPDKMKDAIVKELDEYITNQPNGKKPINELMEHSLPTLLNSVISINFIMKSATDKSCETNQFSIMKNDDNGTVYSNVTASLYLGEDNYPVEMKWYNNTLNKCEGKKTAFKLNKGDLFIVASDFNEGADIDIFATSGACIKPNTKKTAVKKEAKTIKNETQPVEAPATATTVVEETSTEHVSHHRLHRKIVRAKPNGKTEKVWRKSNYTLKEGEEWVDCWKVDKVVYNTLTEAMAVIPSTDDQNEKAAPKKKKPAAKKQKTTAKKEKAAPKKEKAATPVVVAEPTTQSENPQPNQLDKSVEDLPDMLEMDLEDDELSITSSVASVNEHEDVDEDGNDMHSNASTRSQSPTNSVSSHHSEEDEDAEEIQTDDIMSTTNELAADEYEEDREDSVKQPVASPSTKSSNLKLAIADIVNIRLALVTIPKNIKLSDENGQRTDSRQVYLLLNQHIKNLNIGKKHCIGGRVYGFEAEYPVYNVLTM